MKIPRSHNFNIKAFDLAVLTRVITSRKLDYLVSFTSFALQKEENLGIQGSEGC
jgi:hypothetical protein